MGPGPSGIVANGAVGSDGWNAALQKRAQAGGPMNFPRLGQGGPQLNASAIDPRLTPDELERGFLAAMGVAAPSARPAWA